MTRETPIPRWQRSGSIHGARAEGAPVLCAAERAVVRAHDGLLVSEPDELQEGEILERIASLSDCRSNYLVCARAHPHALKVELLVRTTNLPAAVALYRRAGFMEEGCLRGRVCLRDGQFVDDLNMALQLRDNGGTPFIPSATPQPVPVARRGTQV